MKRIRPLILLATFAFLCTTTGLSQVVVTIPVYPTDLDSCTVIFDATQGDAGLKDVPPPIYAHTGVITNLSTGPSDWRYVLAPWNVNIPKALMTPLGNNKYSLKLTPSIREFYGVPQGEQILQLAFVFRNSDGSKSGREANGGDIFYNVFSAVTSVRITEPRFDSIYPMLNDTIAISASSPLADTLSIYVNETLVKKVAGQTITDTLLANNFGQYWAKQWIRVIGKNDTATAADSLFYEVIPAPPVAALPNGVADGINYIDNTTVILSLFAPYKKYCLVTGDFNNWGIDSTHYMSRTPDGNRYWIQLNNLTPQQEYIFQYIVDGTLRIADPYCDKVSDPLDQYIPAETYPNLIPYPFGKTTEIASVLQTAQEPYTWINPTFTPPAATDLVVYELLVRDFTTAHDYPSLIDTLGYLKRLGINAIELMPIMEFEGNISWGYNADFEFAPDKYYGTRNGLKQFIDAAHSNGLAVILDVALNDQFGESPLARLYWDGANQRPAANNPWFNPIPTHPYNVGNDFNHQSPYTQEYCKRVLQYWISEYHADGFRMDLSKGFTQVNSYPSNYSLWAAKDTARINVLDEYYHAVKEVKPDAIFILEHFADNSEETILSADSMLLWGNLNYNYGQAGMGWNAGGVSDFSGISYERRGWTDPHLVGYMESHDEEREMYKNISSGNKTNLPYNCRDTATALNRMELCATFFYTVPGPKMLWMFGELGYDYSINYPTGTSASRLDPKPIRWDYYQQWDRRYLYNTCAALIDLKKTQSVFKSTDYTISLAGTLKTVSLHGSDMDAVVAGNFDVYSGTVVHLFPQTGTWYDYFSGDSIIVTSTSDAMTLEAGEYHLYTSKRLPKPLFTAIGEPIGPAPGGGSSLVLFPNPASSAAKIEYGLGIRGMANLTVYDLFGQPVRVLVKDSEDAGRYQLKWDLRDDRGIRVVPGIYLFVLETPEGRTVQKLIVAGN